MAIFKIQQKEGTETYFVTEFDFKELRVWKDVEEWKKDCLENFCMNKCKGTCCENLFLREDDNFELFNLEGIKKVRWPGKENWFYPLDGYCIYYDHNSKKCMVHEDPRRPQGCSTFPVTLKENKIMLSDGCYLSRIIDKIYKNDSEEATSLVNIAKKYGLSIYVGPKIWYQHNIDAFCCLTNVTKPLEQSI
jgi:hypothetical protein